MSYSKEGFIIPEGLSEKGSLVAKIIQKFAKKKELYAGGCTTFYTPKGWEEHWGEPVGKNVELVVVYEGSELGEYFSYDYAHPDYSTIEKMVKKLKKISLYSEQITSWYSVVLIDN